MSSIIPIIKAEVKKSKILFDAYNKEIFDKLMQGFEGKTISISIKKFRNKRTLNQNSYYWGVVLKLIEEYTGDDKLSLSMAFREMFLKREIVKSINRKFIIIRGTSKLDTEEFSEYIEKIKYFVLQEYQIKIPEAKEVNLDYDFSIEEEDMVLLYDQSFFN